LNLEVRFPDNGHALFRSISFLMRDNESTQARRVNVTWPRRAVVGLWLLAFVVGGGVLAARWDVLMARLARPPAGDTVAEGAPR
jgi:hypothetical protein